MSDVTRILNAIEKGDLRATDELLPLVYGELRVLAAQRLAQESPGQTLQATALVHEAYIRLVEGGSDDWNSRGHFFKAAAEAMRRILVENARRKRRIRHGGDHKRLELDSVDRGFDGPSEDILALDEALVELSQEQPVVAETVKLRYFGGVPLSQIAKILGVSTRTVDRYWAYGRAWLHNAITSADQQE